MALIAMPVPAASSALEQHVGDALQFARAFGQQASFTVRFVSQDKKNGEKLRSMSAEELTSQAPDLIRKSHEEKKHLFLRPHSLIL